MLGPCPFCCKVCCVCNAWHPRLKRPGRQLGEKVAARMAAEIARFKSLPAPVRLADGIDAVLLRIIHQHPQHWQLPAVRRFLARLADQDGNGKD